MILLPREMMYHMIPRDIFKVKSTLLHFPAPVEFENDENRCKRNSYVVLSVQHLYNNTTEVRMRSITKRGDTFITSAVLPAS